MSCCPVRVFVLVGAVLGILAAAAPVAIGAEFDKFDFEAVTSELSTHEAGAHPDLTTKIVMKTDPNSPGGEFPYAALKDVLVSTPPGLTGNLNAVTPCSKPQFLTGKLSDGAGCPFSAQVGISELRFLGGSPGLYFKAPIFLLDEPAEEAVATFGFFAFTVPVFINIGLQSDKNYGLIAEVKNLSAGASVLEANTTFWGVPADHSHDNLRFTPEEMFKSMQESVSHSAGHELAPFLSNPTSCGVPLNAVIEADSYQEPERRVHAAAPLGEITGCDALEFNPALSVVPTNDAAASPSGADATLTIPQNEGFDERAASQMRNAIIRLPEGVTISPGAADGLAACSSAEVGYQISPPQPAKCPDASKIATAVIDSPALTRPIHGAVYQRTPEPGHLFRAWLVADELGLHVKIPGEFQLDPVNGRITSLFMETPQVPVRSLELHFFDGPRGVLATPRVCATYETEYDLAPWSGGADSKGTTPMAFDRGCALPAFAPAFEAGTSDPVAGAFSRLLTTLVQTSGQPNLSRLQVTMPPGVLAKLKGVELCSDAAAGFGQCPAGSLIGHTTVASGFGANPLWIPQPGKDPTAVYLAGPYRGAPYSLVVDTPAEAGPFDLGDVVVRVALRVDPTTTQVTAVSDPLPQFLQGVPVTYREVRLDVDRPDFILNPTSCDPMAVTGSAQSIDGASSVLSTRFQVGGCSRLSFHPKLQLSLKGAPGRSGDPALSARLRMPSGGANVAWTRVTLPAAEQIDNAHINNPCTRVQFNAEACPAKSILGRAVAYSPLLDEPLSGPVYFRSNGGERELPDIVADLRGQIHVVLVGFIDSKRKRLRTTFASVPDAPVSEFKIDLFGGKRGLLENNADLCRTRNRAILQFNGQNGKVADSKPRIAVGCKKKQ